MCIGHGIRVAARAFVTFVKGHLKCLLLLLLLLTAQCYCYHDICDTTYLNTEHISILTLMSLLLDAF